MVDLVPVTQDVLLIGGGHTHALFLQMWGVKPLAGVRLTLINPDPMATYTGMLPGLVAGHYQLDALQIDLVRLARFAGARMVFGKVSGLDPKAGIAHVEGRPPIGFDVASINVGAVSALPGVKGETAMVPARPLGGFAARWQAFMRSVEQGALPIAGVLGGGVGGVELALAMAHRLEAERPGEARVHLFEASPELVPEGRKLRAKLTELLEARDIAVHTGFQAGAFENGMFADLQGRETKLGFLGLATGVQPAEWLGEAGLALEDGFVSVDKYLRSVSHPSVFAVGDIAHMQHAERPKAGVFAVRQAPVLFDNIKAAVSGRRMRVYRPQKDYLKLVSTGGKDAIASKYGLIHAGPLMWRWKDRIDRGFMNRLTRLKPKVAAVPRHAALGVEEMVREGAFGASDKSGQGAAILDIGGVRQFITTVHLSACIDDPYQFAQIAANHALGRISATGTKPQAALVSVILPRMSDALQRRTMAEIRAGAAEVLGPAGAEIVGVQSSIGAELSLGFTLTGIAAERPLTLIGAEPGDALILTKPIGSGVILAGDMQLAARGDMLVNALEVMNREVRADADLLAPVAHAMTDVSGLGLAGHLREMLAAGGLGAELKIDAIPVIEGALALAQRGVHAPLFTQNRVKLGLANGLKGDPRVDLLFDPQTAGGLLAAVPLPDAERLVGSLSGLGWIIGCVKAGSGIDIS